LKSPGKSSPEHFGLPELFALVVQHYSHSTAPNRRYPDLLTQILKGALWHKGVVYGNREPERLAERCTQKKGCKSGGGFSAKMHIAATVMKVSQGLY
jgi:hypothetical protein